MPIDPALLALDSSDSDFSASQRRRPQRRRARLGRTYAASGRPTSRENPFDRPESRLATPHIASRAAAATADDDDDDDDDGDDDYDSTPPAPPPPPPTDAQPPTIPTTTTTTRSTASKRKGISSLGVTRPTAAVDLWAVEPSDWQRMSVGEQRRAWHVARIMSAAADLGRRAPHPCAQCAATRRKSVAARKTHKALRLEECWVYRDDVVGLSESVQCAACRYSRKGCSFVKDRQRVLSDAAAAAAAAAHPRAEAAVEECVGVVATAAADDDGGEVQELRRELKETRRAVAILARQLAEIRQLLGM